MATRILCPECQNGLLREEENAETLDKYWRCPRCNAHFNSREEAARKGYGGKPKVERRNEELVASFGLDMLLKLNQNNHKKHWSECEQKYLLSRIFDELIELHIALYANCLEEAIGECADIANFAAMVADNIKSQLQQKG